MLKRIRVFHSFMVLLLYTLRDSVLLSTRASRWFVRPSRTYKVHHKLGRLQQTSPEKESNTENVKDRVKRKVALVCSYVGSNYFGLQDMNASNSDGSARILPTIESELKRALFLSELVTESNSEDLSKISWSRSSRTDKGVHAARIVITAKLELKRQWLDGNDVSTDETGFIRLPQVSEIMNMHLPPQVRVFSCVKVNNGFQAREACSWRAYEYILPLELLADSDDLGPDPQQDPAVLKALAMLQQCLKKFEGGNISFHNFHRMKGKTLLDTRGQYLRRKIAESDSAVQNGAKAKRQDDDDEEEEEEEEEEEQEVEPEGESNVVEGGERPKRDFTNINMYEDWKENPRLITARCFGTVFYCKAQLCDDTKSNGRMRVRVLIGGQSFMMHQIRLMVGAALLVARGILPMTAVDMALAAPIQLVLPLAPAEGLTLMYSGYMRNVNGQAFSLTRNTAGHETDLILMSADEDKECKEFYQHSIATKVLEDWYANGKQLIKNWRGQSFRYRASEDLVRRWEEIFVACSSKAAKEDAHKAERERIRILKLIQKFQEKYVPDIDRVNSKLFEPKGFVESTRGVPPKDEDVWPFKLFLPNCISTELVMRFGAMPGKQVSEALRALTTQILLDEIPPACSSQELLHYMIHGKLPIEGEDCSENESPEHLRDRLHFWAHEQPKFRMVKWS